MTTVWITYAWEDNEDGDVDFIAQELQAVGLKVKRDRWNIQAGERLWTQIEKFIQSEIESDAWILYATQNSLSSQSCQEEYAYALERALNQRGPTFPVIGLFPSSVDKSLIPAGIRTRLYVSTTDLDWKERILSATQGRSPAVTKPPLEPYSLKVHTVEGGYLIEVRPRAGVWFPFSFAVPEDEREKVGERRPTFLFGAPGKPPPPPDYFVLQYDSLGPSTVDDGTKWWTIDPTGEVSPSKSFFVFATEIPSVIAFGPRMGPLFRVENLR